MNKLHKLKVWVKRKDHPIAVVINNAWFLFRYIEVPPMRIIYKPLGWLHCSISHTYKWLAQTFYWTPMFKTSLLDGGRKLYLYGGKPQVLGPIDITIGSRCRISGCTTFSGRWAGEATPQLIIGDDVGISWQTTIAVGRKVQLGNRVRIAGQCLLSGYAGHPVNAQDRAAGLPDTDDQVGDILLEDDVWLGTGVKVMAGVKIGQGTIVAAGSIVTKNLPANIVAAGIPARPVRTLLNTEPT